MSKTETMPVRILGIESSCDETAAAVVENGIHVLSNVVASQAAMHAKYGGVFPEVASRQHIKTIYSVLDEALQQAHLGFNDLDAIAVTQGPGLAGSLVVGLNAAKGVSLSTGLPMIGINHLESHIYSAWLQTDKKNNQRPGFPLVALLVSGGHSELYLMKDHLSYERLGGTTDDAAGEAFDKVARLLGLSYPGGPAIQNAAEIGDPKAFHLPRARTEGKYDFSFSGLKTAVLRLVRNFEDSNKKIPVADLAASFQEAVVDALVSKTIQACAEFHATDIVVGGGVSANQALRNAILEHTEYKIHIPPLKYCTDNAAMVGAAGYFRFERGYRSDLSMDVLPNWRLYS